MKTGKPSAEQIEFTTPYTALRINVPCVREPTATLIRSPLDCRAALPEAADMAQEACFLLTMNRKNRLIQKHLVTLGVADASLLAPREVFLRAILDGASSLILAHNHCSGNPAPSAEDLAITRQMVAAGRIMGIEVLDHVIIGRPDHFSIREAGLVDFAA